MSVSNKLKRNDLIFIIIVILLICIAGFRPIGLDADSSNYAQFVTQNAGNIGVFTKEPGFWLITQINSFLFSNSLTSFFFLFALVGVTVKAIAIKRLSRTPVIALYAYICLYFVLHEMTQIRVGIASGIFLLAIPDIINNNKQSFFIKTFIACLFHYSAIVMLFLYPLSSSKVNRPLYFLIPIFGILLSLYSSFLLQFLSSIVNVFPVMLSAKVQIYIDYLLEEKYSEINLFNFYYTMMLLFYYILFFNIGKLNLPYGIIFFKTLSFSLFSFYSLSFLPVFSFRVSEFYGVVVIFLISNFFYLFKQKLIVFCATFAWLAFYFIFISLNKNLNA